MKRYVRSKWTGPPRAASSTHFHPPAKDEMGDERDRDDRRSESEADGDTTGPGSAEAEAGAPSPSDWPSVVGELDRALAVVRFLREHCPWDASRTPLTLIPHLQEEAHEVADAIRTGDHGALEGELGDLLLNVAFQVVLGEEEGAFDAASIADRLEEKMARRHPHLFGLGEREDWEIMKARERKEDRKRTEARDRREARDRGNAEGNGSDEEEDPAEGRGAGVLDGLPGKLEPLLRAHRIQERVSGVGFDWAEPLGAWAKVDEELDEVREALQRVRHAPDESTREAWTEELDEELGDLLFAAVNLTRLSGAHASTALHRANEKFARRFGRLESLARERGVDIEEASLDALDDLWDELKQEERDRGR